MVSHFILYVSDQTGARDFYSEVLALQPRLDVPGMTEFELGPSCILGLMPQAGARRLLGLAPIDGPARCPQCELYLVVDDALPFHMRALAAGAQELSPLSSRDWGHVAAYCLDADGNVLAFAQIDSGAKVSG